MSFEVSGKLIAIYETIQRSQTFKTREFVIEKTDLIGDRTISNYIKFQAVQDRTAIVDKVKVGDDVKVSFNIKGSKWQKDGKDNYITNLDAWRIEQVLSGQTGSTTVAATSNTITDPFQVQEADDIADDLPF